MKCLQIVLILMFSMSLFAQNPMDVTTQKGSLQWTRLPSDAEIEAAVLDLKNRSEGTTSVNGEEVDRRRVELTKVQKNHNEAYAGKLDPWRISSATIYMATYGNYRTTINSFMLAQNFEDDKFFFIGTSMGSYRPTSLAEVTREGNGFAPPLSTSSTAPSTSSTDIDGIVPIGDQDEDDIPWTVIIGTITAGAVALILKNLLKKTATATAKTVAGRQTNSKEKSGKNDKKNETEEEKAHYILQLNKESFELIIGQPDLLEVLVYKVTATSQKKCAATIQIQSAEKALQVTPNNGTGSVSAQLLLQDLPKNSSFQLLVSAQADGHQFQKQVQINTSIKKKLMIESANNQKSLRPDTYQVLTCYAKVVDEKGNPINDLSEKIKFEPKSDWMDLSKPEWADDSLMIYIGCSSPNPNKILIPPKSIMLTAIMDDVPEDEPPLRTDFEIAITDCRLETQIEDVTFPETDEPSEVTFWARLENAGSESGWNFAGEYRNGIDPTEPLTDIELNKKTDTEISVTLRGPIIKLSENINQISKSLVISAWQGDEKPIERRLTVIVSREGLFIKRGVSKNNEINFTADKPYDQSIEFALQVYDERSNQIKVDTQSLQNLQFELLNEDQQIDNLSSVLLPSFEFVDLVTNAPLGKYTFSTQSDLPGVGTVYSLKFKVTAPVGSAKNMEVFEQIITINVKTYGIGSEFPDWVKAYEECQYILNNYVPKGMAYNKLSDILEMRKMTLGAEGLKELRNRIWRVAADLILAEGAEGYKSEERWANAITTTLEWTEWAGDIAFSALMAYSTGGLGGTAAGMAKAGMIDALRLYIYEPDKTFDDFWRMQTDKFVPLLMNMAKGRLLSIENIELLVKDNKPLAWTIFISTEFLYNLYQTKSVYDAGKLTAKAMAEEAMVRKLTQKLHQEAMNRKIGYQDSRQVFDDILKNTKTVNGEKVLDNKKLLELMRDPQAIRTIKNHGSTEIKKIFETARNKIYKQHDQRLKEFIKQKYGIPESDIVIDDFRTPGSDPNNVNTDRDYRVLRKVTKADGTTQFIELQRPNWVEKSYEIFGEVTGKPKGLSATEWAEKHQQRGTDRFDGEASSDYSDHIFNPTTGEIENVLDGNIKRVKSGEAKLISAEDIGRMYRTKVENAVKNGTKPEAYAQLQKSIHTLEDVRKGYSKQNLDVPELDTKFKNALAYAKTIKTDASGTLDPQNMKNIETQIKSMTGYDLNKMTLEIEKSFKDLKVHDKGRSN